MSTATPDDDQHFPQQTDESTEPKEAAGKAETPAEKKTETPAPAPEEPPRDPGQGLPDPEKVGPAKFFVDVAERAVATYLEVFVGLIAVADKIDMKLVTAASVAAIPAGLSVVKAGLGRFLGDRKSAALLPRKLLSKG